MLSSFTVYCEVYKRSQSQNEFMKKKVIIILKMFA